MAKNAATEQVLGDLHAKVARVFIRVCEGYEEDMKQEHVDVDGATIPAPEVNPAMMGAMTKFLKDNSIAFDTEELEVLSDTEQRLAQRRKQRAKLIDLTNLKVGNG